jgi:hypothetical protein
MTKQLAVMWVIGGRKVRDIMASNCRGELDPVVRGIRGLVFETALTSDRACASAIKR